MSRALDVVVPGIGIVLSATGATDPTGGLAGTFIQYGAMGAVILYFIYRDYRRDEDVRQQIADLNKRNEALVNRLMNAKGDGVN